MQALNLLLIELKVKSFEPVEKQKIKKVKMSRQIDTEEKLPVQTENV